MEHIERVGHVEQNGKVELDQALLGELIPGEEQGEHVERAGHLGIAENNHVEEETPEANLLLVIRVETLDKATEEYLDKVAVGVVVGREERPIGTVLEVQTRQDVVERQLGHARLGYAYQIAASDRVRRARLLLEEALDYVGLALVYDKVVAQIVGLALEALAVVLELLVQVALQLGPIVV